ncbi:MAG TPA: ABC transporter permease [Spirochaetia bacterium]|nr:ABC transporter permease [Spirochaetia bacterium]
MILLRLAFRNMREHRAKTLIVGVLVTLGAFTLTAGNSFLDSLRAGQRRTFVESFTGDLIVRAESDEAYSLTVSPARSPAPELPGFPEVRERAEALDGVAAVLPLVNSMATLSAGETAAGFSMLWGVDFAEYRAMFPESLELVEGDWPAEPGAWILVSEATRREAEAEAEVPVRVGDRLLVTGMGEGGTKIREVTLAGVFRFRRGNNLLDRISLTDPGTVRSLAGLTLARREAASSESSETGADAAVAAPAVTDEDALFSGFSIAAAETSAGPADFDSILGDTSARARYSAVDSDAWNFLLIRLADGRDAGRAAEELGAAIGAGTSGLVVSDWSWGAGVQADLSRYLRLAFNGIVLIVVAVAAIIIMNTLVISITERIPEIGTMRAIGAGRAFVRRMILTETLMVSLAFGALGVLAGCVAVGILGRAGISSSNEILATLFGGEVFRPAVSAAAVAGALAAMAMVGVLSCLYPVSVALRITPVRALQKA